MCRYVHVFLDPREEADFNAYKETGSCFFCGLSGKLAREASSIDAAASAATTTDTKTDTDASGAEAPAETPVTESSAESAPVEQLAGVGVLVETETDAMEVEGAEVGGNGSAVTLPRPETAAAPMVCGDMLQCQGCGDRFHFGCLDTNLESKPETWSTWRCLECKTCQVCGHDGSKIRLAICEECHEGSHICCLDPPLKSFPHRAFKCPKCVQCQSCGTREAKKWRSDYAMCEPCGRLIQAGKYCPICMAVYGKHADVDMVECDKCKFWVHAACDGLDGARLANLNEAGEAYSCPNCRGERTYALMGQVPLTYVYIYIFIYIHIHLYISTSI